MIFFFFGYAKREKIGIRPMKILSKLISHYDGLFHHMKKLLLCMLNTFVWVCVWEGLRFRLELQFPTFFYFLRIAAYIASSYAPPIIFTFEEFIKINDIPRILTFFSFLLFLLLTFTTLFLTPTLTELLTFSSDSFSPIKYSLSSLIQSYLNV